MPKAKDDRFGNLTKEELKAPIGDVGALRGEDGTVQTDPPFSDLRAMKVIWKLFQGNMPKKYTQNKMAVFLYYKTVESIELYEQLMRERKMLDQYHLGYCERCPTRRRGLGK